MIRTFKASSYTSERTPLNSSTIRENTEKNIFTNIMLDTNILLSIARAYLSTDSYQSLKNYGIIDLVDLVHKSGNCYIFISPAAAYQELPQARRSVIEAIFENFLREYLPTFHDDPNSTAIIIGGLAEGPNSFSSLTPTRQKSISCSYASLLAMNIIHNIDNLESIDKFKLYAEYCSDTLNLLSLKELTIARYGFAPENGITEELRHRKVAVKNNFLKLKSRSDRELTFSETVKMTALNGANDLKLINIADSVDNSEEQIGLRSFTHDVWIATSDEKLYQFCCACPGWSSAEGGGGPAFRFIDTHSEITGTPYWRDSLDIQDRILENRCLTLPQGSEVDHLVQFVLDLESKLDNSLAVDYFRNRAWR